MSESAINKRNRRRVFITYAAADVDVARKIEKALEKAGLEVWRDKWGLEVLDSYEKSLEQALASSDICLVLLSKKAVAAHFVQQEFNAALSMELRNRAVTVVPALIEDCDVPPPLADRQYLDMRGDLTGAIQRLVQQLSAATYLDFSKLDARTFKEMVGVLLERLGFSFPPLAVALHSSIDIVASYRGRDPFGAEQMALWLVEVKFHQHQRVSISVLRQLDGYLMVTPGKHFGLIVTNGSLTSVAWTFLESLEKSGREIRVIDGTELTNLLVQYPDIVQEYFPKGADHE